MCQTLIPTCFSNNGGPEEGTELIEREGTHYHLLVVPASYEFVGV
jgi:hypothetical protein